MLIENTPFSYLVEFDTGTPVGVFTYSLYDDDGNPVASLNNVNIIPEVGAVSVLIEIPNVANTLTKPLFESRTLAWYYTTSLGAVNGSFSYQIQKKVPFPVTYDGVRTKLGVDKFELPDDRIDLLMAYVEFNEVFTNGLDAYASLGNSTALKITNAIEAIAALKVLPTLQLSLARKMVSGTNQYERWATIDWDAIIADLQGIIYDTTILIEPTMVYVASSIFELAVRTDPYIGA
jgi:hypothetical protein